MSKKANNKRSQRAATVLQEFAAFPLMDQGVLYSPRFLDGNIEKEVCDLLLLHRQSAILVSLKARDTERSVSQTKRWAAKQAKKSLKQLRGGSRSLRERMVWCEHRSLGEMRFDPGTVSVVHGVALIEADYEMQLDISDSPTLIEAVGVPTSLMSVADFLHILRHLRTWRDLAAYLDARCKVLTHPDRATLGAEIPLLGYYTAMRDSFSGCQGIADAKIVTARGEHVRVGAAFRDREVALASPFEDVLRCLSLDDDVALPPCMQPVVPSDETLAAGRRLMREDLCHLSIQERAALGEQIARLSGELHETRPDAPLFGGVRFGRHEEDAYMVVVARGADQLELRTEAFDLIVSYCVYHEKKRGFVFSLNEVNGQVVADAFFIGNVQPSLEMQMVGEERFGRIRPRSVTGAR